MNEARELSAPQLSEGQIRCLERVARGMSSKEIARDLGFSPLTVDTYLKQAMAELGVSNRREAARRVVGDSGSQNLGSQAQGLAEPPEKPKFEPGRSERNSVRGIPPFGGRRNRLGWAERHWAMLIVAGASLAIVLAITVVVVGVFWVFA